MVFASGVVTAGALISDEQRAFGQFHRFAISVAIVHQKAVVLRRCNPGVATIRAENQPQAAVARCIGTMQADECAIAQHVQARRIHPHPEGHRRSPRAALIVRPRDIALGTPS